MQPIFVLAPKSLQEVLQALGTNEWQVLVAIKKIAEARIAANPANPAGFEPLVAR
jgi:hypothetical protein